MKERGDERTPLLLTRAPRAASARLRLVRLRLRTDHGASPGALERADDLTLGVDIGSLQATLEPNTGAFTVVHPGTGREVLANVPGRAFVGAAVGQEAISEGRGLFYLTDRLSLACATQTIDRWGPSVDESVVVDGRLLCGSTELP